MGEGWTSLKNGAAMNYNTALILKSEMPIMQRLRHYGADRKPQVRRLRKTKLQGVGHT